MSIIRWDPFDEIMSMRESMDRLFEDFFSRRPRQAGPLVWQPAVEISETDNEVTVRAELPGIDPKNVEVAVTGDTLTIKGEAKAEQEDKGRNYYRRELRYGMFQRAISLPTEVKGDETKATFRHGILEVRIPKSERVRPKTIKVDVNS
ncbi:MAG: Hsp20/alpha crystallin family protein [Armatimonadota bacterium]|nr:Hsp20/alpha crystallin family protein [Armatimonadota bacterium]